MAMVLSLLGIALPEGAVCADSLLAALGDSRQCDFSLQLQKSPYRENFIARIATIVTTYWASNDDPTIASDASDASDFSLSRFGTNNTAEHRETDIDSFSKECLNCHDGLRATDVTVDYRNEPGISGRGRHVSGKDHPIGMYYASYAALGRGYKPAAMLNRKMVLVNGKVGCLTCHNPLNPERSHLVMSDYRSALCLSCHDK
ncbi:MAG TPA: cytochrome c3 family protein [Geobacteraceae bacterium]